MKRTRQPFLTFALLGMLASALPATPASAQCVPPNLTVANATCALGKDCAVSIDLDTNSEDFSAAAATMSSPGDIACQTPCSPGADASGNCFINTSTCAWNVTDFSLAVFGDGEAAVITIQCNELGTFDLDLTNASLGRPNGQPQASCGISGSVDCRECLSDGDCSGGQLCDGGGSCVDCIDAGDCDDTNACTADSCNAGSCTNDAAAMNGQACNDGQFCTDTDTCNAGSCTGTGDPCPGTECADTCNESTDSCFDVAGTGCSDGDLCTESDQCNGSGTCIGSAVDCSHLDDGCSAGMCNPGDGSCFADPLPAATSCSDGAFCNGSETCDGAGTCTAGTAPDCDDGVGCTDDGCNEVADTCDNIANDANCDDGAFCNGSETCDAVSDCQAGVAPDCDDGVGCTDDGCNEAADTCDNTVNDANCDDGAFCNGSETCNAVSDCVAGQFPCSDAVTCTVDGCDEPTDTCSHEPADSQCDDGLACNGAETCDAVAGCMSETPLDCSSLDDECNVGVCSDEDAGCAAQPLEDGTSCEDGNACTIDDQCMAGICLRTSFCGVPVSRGDAPVASDALFTLRAGVSLEVCDPCECDVNADERVTAVDALTILQSSVALDVDLNCFVPVSASVLDETGSEQ